MITPAPLDLGGDRWVAFRRLLPLVGINLTDATFLMHVRATNDAVGSPLVTMATTTVWTAEGVRLAYAGTDTVANHVTAERLAGIPPGYFSTDTLTLSLVSLQINETTMETLPFPAERGGDTALVWDLQITPSGGTKDKYVGGKFIVRAGATT